MNYFELGWMIVAFVLLLVVLAAIVLSIISKVKEIYESALWASKVLTLHKYANSLKRQSHWFSASDSILVEAIVEDMLGEKSIADAQAIRDVYLPEIIRLREMKGGA